MSPDIRVNNMQCQEKKRYEYYVDAGNVAHYIKLKTGKGLGFYLCKECDYFHLTSKKEATPNQKRKRKKQNAMTTKQLAKGMGRYMNPEDRKISLIVARSDNNVIGVENELPWRIPKDLQWFKEKTKSKPVIMGRKTHESIGRLLPARPNIVISRNPDYQPLHPKVILVQSFGEALEAAKYAPEIMVIGGEQIYRLALPLAKTLYITQVHTVIENGDAFFPEFDEDEWVKTSIKDLEPDPDSEYEYEFTIFARS